jgi:hypothetical protein
VGLVVGLGFVNILRVWGPRAGERGLLPADELVRSTDRFLPTLFRRGCPDRLAMALAWVGLAVAAALVAGLPQRGPWWAPLVTFLVLWVLYLSYVTVGRVFCAFGWETLLLEAGFLAIFLGNGLVQGVGFFAERDRGREGLGDGVRGGAHRGVDGGVPAGAAGVLSRVRHAPILLGSPFRWEFSTGTSRWCDPG